MKQLVRTDQNLHWQLQPGESRLYITDQLPPKRQCATAFGFIFDGEQILLTHLRHRDWDIPGGRIERGETPAQAAIREVWEETNAKVEVIELIGIQELETFAPKPDGYRWPYPISAQIYYLCRLVELSPFEINVESFERGFFAPEQARLVPTLKNHAPIYEEALKRIRAS